MVSKTIKSEPITRRRVLKAGAVMPLAALVPVGVHRGRSTIRVGVIGCGGRGTGAARDCSKTEGVEIVAMGDLFADRMARSRKNLSERIGASYKVDDAHAFVGFDACDRVLACDVDLVILATPPAFRPQQLEKAINAGKHVFMEKPVAVCPAGIRQVIEVAAKAKEKRLSLVAGTQRRHQAPYLETIKRIHDGAIGDVVAARCYWNQGFLWHYARKRDDSDVEWQVRNWLYFTWLSGDHIVEQHIHNIDVINWVMGGPPKRARGMGGRQVRTNPKFGQIFDHFAIEYEYPNGAHCTSMCRQIDGTWREVGEQVIGTEGTSAPGGWIRGESKWAWKGKRISAYVQEHADLIASIRAGEPLNEGKRVAESTLTAIMGRMSAYTGKTVTWDFARNKSQLDLRPQSLDFGQRPAGEVSVPGVTPLV